MEILHFSHEHPLTPWDEDFRINCFRCGESDMSPITGCSRCGFSSLPCYACRMPQRYPTDPYYYCNTCLQSGFSKAFHKSCIELPQQIQLSVHPNHPLTFVHSQDDDELTCHFCGSCLDSLSFRCDQCAFRVDYKCGSRFLKHHDGRDIIETFMHRHPFVQLDWLLKDEVCKVCESEIYDPVYGCQMCEFYVHSKCFDEVRQEIKHDLHPLHSLKWKEFVYSDSSSGDVCDACLLPLGRGTINCEYECELCDFHLHAKCTTLIPNLEYAVHMHNLVLVYIYSKDVECEFCGFEILGEYCARCVMCNISYHSQCVKSNIPFVLESAHHKHTLMFVDMSPIKDDSYCDVCQRNLKCSSYYCCAECGYFAHVACVLELQLDYRKGLRHFSHPHDLILYENDEKNKDVFCAACEKEINRKNPAYYCSPCHYYIHKSCFELPTEVLHYSLHPDHLLSLPTTFIAKGRYCNACDKPFWGFAYRCEKCDFAVDLDCGLQPPSIELDELGHQLTLLQLYYKPICKLCNSMGSGLSRSYLCCCKCKYNVHIKCLDMLPETMEHECHEGHSLTLKDYFLEHEIEEIHYCDHCEEERDIRDCVYCCEECHFVVDIDCVSVKVLDLLASIREGNRQDLKLRRVERKSIHKKILKGLTFRELHDSLSEEENKILDNISNDINMELCRNEELRSSISKDYSFYLDESSLLFTKDISFKEGSEVIWDVKGKVIQLENYLIIEGLSDILKTLLKKYGDIGGKCCLTQRLKTFLLTKFCGSLRMMSHTRIGAVDERLLFTWWNCCKQLEHAGFDVGFVFDRLKQIARTRFGSKVESFKDNRLSTLYSEMGKSIMRIDELKKEIEQCAAEVETYKLQIREQIESSRSEERLLNKRILEELDSHLEIAAKGLL